MTPTLQAILGWIPPEEGGRKAPPSGPVYTTTARFEDDPNWPHEVWSLVVRMVRPFRQGRNTLAEVSFLAEGAPHNLLQPGSRFELMEGPHRVAKGIVLPISVPVPDELDEFESALIG